MQKPHDPDPSLVAIFSFVALDWANKRPTPVPQLQPLTPQEQQWAQERQQLAQRWNAFYRAHPAMWERDFTGDGFTWLEYGDADHNTVSFVRRDAAGNPLVVVANFSGSAHQDYRVPLPDGGIWSPSRRPLTVGLILTVTLVALEALAVATVMPEVRADLVANWRRSGSMAPCSSCRCS